MILRNQHQRSGAAQKATLTPTDSIPLRFTFTKLQFRMTRAVLKQSYLVTKLLRFIFLFQARTNSKTLVNLSQEVPMRLTSLLHVTLFQLTKTPEASTLNQELPLPDLFSDEAPLHRTTPINLNFFSKRRLRKFRKRLFKKKSPYVMINCLQTSSRTLSRRRIRTLFVTRELFRGAQLKRKALLRYPSKSYLRTAESKIQNRSNGTKTIFIKRKRIYATK